MDSRLNTHVVESLVDVTFNEKKLKKIGYNDPSAKMLLSFPRSGNGWLRLLLFALILESHKHDVTDLKQDYSKINKDGKKYSALILNDLTLSSEELIPNIYQARKASDFKNSKYFISLFKTHHICNYEYHRCIYLFRDPLECLTSASLLLNGPILSDHPELINDCIIHFSKYYKEMLNANLEAYNTDKNLLLLLNLDLLSEDTTHLIKKLKRICNFLDLRVSDDSIEKIVRTFPFISTYNKDYNTYIKDETKSVLKENLYPDYEKLKSLSTEFDG